MNPNKSVVEKFIAALGKGEGQVLGTLMTEDVAATCTGTSLVSGTRSYSDLVTVAGVLKQLIRNGISFRILTMTAEEDRVSCEVEGTSTLINDVPYNNQYHFLFFIRNGKIYKLKEYIDTKLADATLAPLMQSLQNNN